MNERSDGGAESPVFERLLDATERLWATQPPSRITMRAIAKEAGLSVGLAYNYVNGRDELYGTVLDRVAARISASAREGEDFADVLNSLWAAMEANPAFHRLVTWLTLEGVNVTEIMQNHPLIAGLTHDMAARTTEDARLIAGVIGLLGISMETFEAPVNRTMGYDDADPRLRAAISSMYGSWFSADGANSSV